MKRKSLIVVIFALIFGIVAGAGGTYGAERYILKTASQTSSNLNTLGPLLDLGEFTVNLQGGAFLKTSITVEVTDTKAQTSLKEEDAFLKDRVNSVLANKSLADVQTPEAREKLRKELINQLNEVSDNKIMDVLFVSLVYQ